MRESELHKHIESRSVGLLGGAGWRVAVGPGDDAAVLESPNGDTMVITVDQLVEGRHYEAGTELDLIARKAIARSVSDVAAMGAAPAWALATGVLAPDDPEADALFDAMHRWANHWRCPLVGGDIATWGEPNQRVLSVTVAGSIQEGHVPVLRSGARPGDLVYLTGQVGGSFESGWHLRFEPRVQHGLWASSHNSGVSAMIDLSDGLGRDTHRVGRKSGVLIEIEAAALPISHRCDDWRRACEEGEDYELLMCIDPRAEIPEHLEPALIGPVGVCTPIVPGTQGGAVVIGPHGRRVDAQELGWDH